MRAGQNLNRYLVTTLLGWFSVALTPFLAEIMLRKFWMFPDLVLALQLDLFYFIS